MFIYKKIFTLRGCKKTSDAEKPPTCLHSGVVEMLNEQSLLLRLKTNLAMLPEDCFEDGLLLF